MRTCRRTRLDWSASCNAKASGAFREPGQSTTSRTPPRISSSTTTRAWVVEGFTPTGCHRLKEPHSAVGLAEELEHGGVDGVGPFEETKMAGIGYLNVTATRQRVGDLAAQVWRGEHVVGEADYQHRGRDAAVGGQPVGVRRDIQLRTHARSGLDGAGGKHRDPVGDCSLNVERLAGEVLQQADFGVVGGGQLDTGVGHLGLGVMEELPGSVHPAAGPHQHRRADQLGPGEHQFLGDESAHRHPDDAGWSHVEAFDQRHGVGDHGLRREALGVLGGADSAIVERDDAVSGRQERGELIGVPGSSGAAVAGNKYHGLTGAAVVVSQVDHADDGTSSRWQALTRSIHHWRRSGAARSACSRSGSGVTGPTGRQPSKGAAVSATSSTKRPPVPSPQAWRSCGRAAAAVRPAAMPTAESSALETTTGMSICAAMASMAEIPPSGATLSTAMSAAPARTTASGSSALRMLSSAAIGTSTRRRSTASSSTVAHGCSRYSSGPSAVNAAAAAAASSTLQPPLASTRTVGTSSRTALTRATSSDSAWPGSAT